MKADIEEIDHDLANLVEVTANWFRFLKQKYGAEHPRLTEIRNFDTIQAATVAEANQKLYINRADGFIGTSLKKDEYVCNCSDIDDVILFYRDGTYKVVKVTDKLFVGETEKSKKEKRKAEILHIAVLKKNDARTIYNVCYKDGATGVTFIKRFNVTTVTRDREYDATSGTPKSRITYFSANANGEAEIIKVTLKPHEKIKKLTFDKDFSEIAIKGRASRGNQLTKNEVFRIQLKAHGGSTLGGRKVWFDRDVQRLNYDEHGEYLGEFHNDDQILVILDNGEYYVSNFDVNNHYEQNIVRIEKYDKSKVWTAVLWDADNQNLPYIKRFLMDASTRKQNYLGENPDSRQILLTDTVYPRLLLKFADNGVERPDEEIDAEQFIAVKGFKAKGKRITTFPLASVTELEPLRVPEPEEQEGSDDGDGGDAQEVVDPDEGKSDSDIRDEITGQLKLF
jgi:topoisomerase-4 subunit A